MISYSDIIQVLNAMLKSKYPKIKRYGNDTTEGWKKPYFL